MRHTHLSILDIASEVEAAPSQLLTVSNPKTQKGIEYGYLTAILHLAPHKASGANVCPNASPGCIAACLNTSGKGMAMTGIHVARIRKTKWFRQDRPAFMLRLEKDIVALHKVAYAMGLELCIRLNGTSDLRWERLPATFADGKRGVIMDRFADTRFYDYTKVSTRFGDSLPANYDLTFSLAENNRAAADYVLEHDGRVAVVFRNADRPTAQARRWTLPDSWQGRPIVDADKHDLRFLDPHGVWCGLKAKGLATVDATGFVYDITPAAFAA